jgi:hypothetical protein
MWCIFPVTTAVMYRRNLEPTREIKEGCAWRTHQILSVFPITSRYPCMLRECMWMKFPCIIVGLDLSEMSCPVISFFFLYLPLVSVCVIFVSFQYVDDLLHKLVEAVIFLNTIFLTFHYSLRVTVTDMFFHCSFCHICRECCRWKCAVCCRSLSVCFSWPVPPPPHYFFKASLMLHWVLMDLSISEVRFT